ncbi:FtsK/SpoIIIE domain-containing protein [Spirillospora sp. NPDC047279]|uniref:FtsK/SpoIIIE domain-containing protein n=1 Tax=Spirillospora sp. NPDC047279 TaxID=3155478 RepID=UPI0033D3228F
MPTLTTATPAVVSPGKPLGLAATERSRVPVGSMLSMYDPIPIGMDEFQVRADLPLAYRNLIAAGVPDSGKSGLIQNIGCYSLLCDRTHLVLLDGKQVELGLFRDALGDDDLFIGPDLEQAIRVMQRLQRLMNNRSDWLLARRRRKFTRTDPVDTYCVIIDEVAFFSATIGTREQRQTFIDLLRDLVARGRALGLIVIAATQRPSIDIIPKSLRDLFAYRAAFRCMSEGSSDIILGDNLAAQGYDATDIPMSTPGVCWLLAENGVTPRKIKAAYLTDDQIIHIVDFAAWTRRTGRADHRAQATAASPFLNAA